MNLSGWARLWIVSIPLLWISGFLLFMPVKPSDIPPFNLGGSLSDCPDYQTNVQKCFDDIPMQQAANAKWQAQRDAWGLRLIAILASPLASGAVIFAVAWVVRGFRPAAQKSLDPNPSDSD